MRIKNLPQKDRQALDSAFRSSSKAREQNRIQVIRLLSQGYPRQEVGRITGYSDGHIRQLITRYNQGGIEGLRLKPSPKNRAKLTNRQKDKLKQILQENNTPSKAGLKVKKDQDYWSISTLAQLIKQKYQVTYKSTTSYRQLMKFAGMSYQRVEFEDNRRKPEARDKFKTEFDIKLKKGVMRMSW
jgi:transposase